MSTAAQCSGGAPTRAIELTDRYHAQLAFAATKFPSDIGQQFTYSLPFPPPYSLTPDAPISLPSLTYERASVLFNAAAIYASLAAFERRAEAESIKRALSYLTVRPHGNQWRLMIDCCRHPKLHSDQHSSHSQERARLLPSGWIRHERVLLDCLARLRHGTGAGVLLAAGSSA